MSQPLCFSISRIREKGKLDFSGVVEAARFDDPLSAYVKLAGPVSVDLQVSLREGRVWIIGHAKGRWELECCRCLAKAPVAYAAEVSAVLDQPKEQVDAFEEIRQALLLALPAKPYCKPACLGLCAQCGQDKNLKDCGCRQQPPQFKIKKRGKTDA